MLKSKLYLGALIISPLLFFLFAVSAQASLVGNTNQATLTLSPQTGTYNAGASFSLSVYVNTHSLATVGASAYLTYNKSYFHAVSIDTSASVYTIQWEQQIDETSDPTNGKIKITRTIPTPGFTNSAATGLVAVINFTVVGATSPSSDNITFDFTPGVSINSQVIKDDQLGTNILSGVYNGMYTTGGTDNPPAVSITAPIAGATVSGSSVTVSATASDTDSTPVAGVQFKLDGANLGSEDTSSPYSITWNTVSASNGSHTLTAVARDTGGLTTTSAGVSVTVNNGDSQAPTMTAFAIPSTATSLTVTFTTPPAATDNVAVTGYIVTESATAPSASVAGWSTTAPTSYTFTSAGTKTLYAWAKDAAGNVSTSRSATVTITITDGQSPTAPTGFSATAYSATQINLSWTASTDNVAVTGYNIYRNGTKIASVTVTSYSDSGLSSSTSYSYAVEAYDAAGNKSVQATAAATTLPPSDDITPPVISGIAVSPISSGAATVTWTTNEAADSKVIYGTVSSSLNLSSSLSTLTTSHSINLRRLKGNTTYYYQIISKDAAGNQAISTAASFTTLAKGSGKPPKVRNLTATAGSVILAWETDDYGFYKNEIVFRKTDSFVNDPLADAGNLKASLDPYTQAYTDTDVVLGTTYYYSVFTVDDEGLYSDPATVSFYVNPQGKVIIKRGANDPKVYVIENGQKRWVTSTAAFEANGYDWSQVQVVDPSEIAQYPDGPPISVVLMKLSNDPKIYVLVGGKLRWIANLAVFNAGGYSWNDVQVVSADQLNQYLMAKLVRVSGDEKIYYITNGGLRRWVINESVFASYGNQWEDVVRISAQELNAYPVNNLIHLDNDPKIYLVTGTTKQWIKTAAAFNARHYNWASIAPVNQTEFNAYQEGAAIQ